MISCASGPPSHVNTALHVRYSELIKSPLAGSHRHLLRGLQGTQPCRLGFAVRLDFQTKSCSCQLNIVGTHCARLFPAESEKLEFSSLTKKMKQQQNKPRELRPQSLKREQTLPQRQNEIAEAFNYAFNAYLRDSLRVHSFFIHGKKGIGFVLNIKHT